MRLNDTMRTWLATLGVLGVVVGVVALAGGFAPQDASPLAVPVGEPVQVTRWEVAVDGCEVEPDGDGGGEVSIRLTVTNRWRGTLERLDGAVALLLPTGERFGFGEDSFRTDNVAAGGFDPGFRAKAVVRATFEEPVWDAAAPVRVALHDERTSDGYLLNARWFQGTRVAVVDVACEVLEVEEE